MDQAELKLQLAGGEAECEELSKMLQPEVASVLQLAKRGHYCVAPGRYDCPMEPSAEQLYGYLAEEIMGQSISRLLPGGDSDELTLMAERVRRGETIEDFETRSIRKDGRTIEVSLTLSPIRDEIGKVVGVLCLGVDVSEHRRLVRAERDQFFLAALVSSAEDAIVSKTLQGIVTSWNPGAEKLFGYTAAEMLGRPIALLVPSDHPDEEPQILERIRRGERIEHYETHRVRKDADH